MAKLTVNMLDGESFQLEVADDYEIPESINGWFHFKGLGGTEMRVHGGNIQQILKFSTVTTVGS